MSAVWTAPRTWTTGELVTKTIMDAHVRDNLDFLKTPANSGIITTASDFTTTSASFTDVTWATTTFTNYGGGFLVLFQATLSNSSLGAITNFDLMVDGAALGGSSGIGAVVQSVAAYAVYQTIMFKVAAASAGSHTIKLRVKTSTGTLTINGTTSNVKPIYYVCEFGA